MSIKSNFFRGLKFITVDSLLSRDFQDLEVSRGSSIHLIAASTIVSANNDPLLMKCLEANSIICDSKPLHFFLKLSGITHSYIRGADFLRLMLCHENSKKHLFIVSSEQLAESLRVKFSRDANPKRQIDFLIPSHSNNLQFLLNEIVDNRNLEDYDYVWIGLGSPKQDFLSSFLANQNRSIFIGIGAALQFVAEKNSEAPKMIRDLGLEWFFRLMREPRRLWRRYLIGNWIFILIVLKCFIIQAIYKIRKMKQE